MMEVMRGGLAPEVSQILQTMPAAYGLAFTPAEVAEHARIVRRRGAQLAHAEAWTSRDGEPCVCVVADDRPGLLSLVTQALLVQGLNVARAQVYCRAREDGTSEAVDFFWLAPTRGSLEEREIDAASFELVAQTLRELIGEDQLFAEQSRERDTVPVPGPRPSRVYFDNAALQSGEYWLIVETLDYPGLLFTIASALHGLGILILASEIRTASGFAEDRFGIASATVEPLSPERLCDVQQAVYAAVCAERRTAERY